MYLPTKGRLKKKQQRTYLMMFMQFFFFLSFFIHKKHMFWVHTEYLFKKPDKMYTTCYLKTMKLLDCALIGVCVVIRLNMVNATNIIFTLIIQIITLTIGQLVDFMCLKNCWLNGKQLADPHCGSDLGLQCMHRPVCVNTHLECTG